jgi:hypothetical protein
MLSAFPENQRPSSVVMGQIGEGVMGSFIPDLSHLDDMETRGRSCLLLAPAEDG